MVRNKGHRLLRYVIYFVLAAMPISSLCAYSVQGFDLGLTPYFKAGSTAWDESGGRGGHKFLTAYGLRADADFGCVLLDFNAEGWLATEDMGDDEGIVPEYGWHIFTDAKYCMSLYEWTAYPLLRLGYKTWDRGSNVSDWDDLSFGYLGLGGGVEGCDWYVQGAFTLPLGPSASPGENPSACIGFTGQMGIWYQCFLLGMFFDADRLEDPDGQQVQAGFLFGYRVR